MACATARNVSTPHKAAVMDMRYLHGIEPGNNVILSPVSSYLGGLGFARRSAAKVMKIACLVSGLLLYGRYIDYAAFSQSYGLVRGLLDWGRAGALIHDGCAVFLWPSSCNEAVCWGCQRVEFPHVRIHPVHDPVHRLAMCWQWDWAWGRGRVVGHDCWSVRSAPFFGWLCLGKWKTFYHARQFWENKRCVVFGRRRTGFS